MCAAFPKTHRRQSWRPFTIPAVACEVDDAAHHLNVPVETGDRTVDGGRLLLDQRPDRSTPLLIPFFMTSALLKLRPKFVTPPITTALFGIRF